MPDEVEPDLAEAYAATREQHEAEVDDPDAYRIVDITIRVGYIGPASRALDAVEFATLALGQRFPLLASVDWRLVDQ